MISMTSSLCLPDKDKSCFACCPPIRPAGYEHIHHQNIIKRLLRENSRDFSKKDSNIIPITGFSCWALGYINKGHRQIGCLLHPGQNNGIDLRYRVNYGEKCRREACQEAKTFSRMDVPERNFWLRLTDGLDSFAYSSREINPLFKILGWGSDVLGLIAKEEAVLRFDRESFIELFPFFATTLPPKGNAYLLNCLLSSEGIHVLKNEIFRPKFEKFSVFIAERVTREQPINLKGQYAHLLDIDRDFSDFLRLCTGISRIEFDEALVLKTIVDEEIERFRKETF